MTISRPCSRLKRSAAGPLRRPLFRYHTHHPIPSLSVSLASSQPRRTYAQGTHPPPRRGLVGAAADPNNPLLESYLDRKERERVAREVEQAGHQGPNMPDLGTLAHSSIFQRTSLKLTPPGKSDSETAATAPHFEVPPGRNARVMAAKLDPVPEQRQRWERDAVIASIQSRGRLSKAALLKRTERALTDRSQFWRTSMKKLAPLARQIAGKPIDDAITQMRFSMKKPARWVLAHLEEARDKAVVERGMGLGKVSGEAKEAWEARAKSVAEAKGGRGRKGETHIRLKDGTGYTVTDPTRIYVDQAWVNKGRYGTDVAKRARGRRDKLRLPTTSITVLLKEDKTRVRLHEERVAKEARKKPWVQLPNRPISTPQKPYYCW